jgi:hypothetical protein
MESSIEAMEPHRYGRQLTNMALLGLAAGWVSSILSVMKVWGA